MSRIMKLTFFAKKGTRVDDKGNVQTYWTYNTRLTKKDGTQEYATVIAKDDCKLPRHEQCPINVKVKVPEHGSRSEKQWKSDDGTKSGTNVLFFCSEWEPDLDNPFVDKSLDDYI